MGSRHDVDVVLAISVATRYACGAHRTRGRGGHLLTTPNIASRVLDRRQPGTTEPPTGEVRWAIADTVADVRADRQFDKQVAYRR
jgi:hypothetical protein